MTKPREKKREELQAEIEDGKKKIRQLENREKVLRQKLSQEERRLSPACPDERGSAGLSEKTHRGREKRIIPLVQRAHLYTLTGACALPRACRHREKAACFPL